MFACRLGQKAALNARLDEPEAVPRENYESYEDKNGSPGVIRTPDQRFRNAMCRVAATLIQQLSSLRELVSRTRNMPVSS
jgi:hypothetical protein